MLINKITSDLNNGKFVESTKENQEQILEAVEMILAYGNREARIFVAVNEISQKAYVCLYAEPLMEMGEEAIGLKRDEEHKWIPEKRLLDYQSAKLVRDSQDFQ